MEHLTGIMVTYPIGTQLPGNHRKLACKYLEWVKEDPAKMENLYARYREWQDGCYTQFVFLLVQYCTGTVLEELDAILALTHPSREYRHIMLDNGVVVVYAVGRIAYLLSLALAFGFGPLLQIRDSYEC